MWLEEEEKDEIYFAKSYPICTLDATIGGWQPNEDDLIDQILQNQSPNTMSLDELVKKVEDDPGTDFFLADSSPTHVKMVEFGPDRTLKINLSLSAHHEKELCNMLREQLDAFSWIYNAMKGVHPSMCTHHIFIKEVCKPVHQPRMRMNPTLKDIVKEEL